MKDGSSVSKRPFWMVPLLLMFCGACVAQAPVPTAVTDEETELGMEVYKELRGQAQIIAASPLYDTLAPIAKAIVLAAQPQYSHPFKFYLVHGASPNAFSVPGGHVYVVDSLLYSVRNTEQLAGTLCHEVAHTIHRDSMALIEKEKEIARRSIGAAILLGPTKARILAIAMIGKMQELGYSRDVEAKADLTGADICAAAGYNPWGLVWLFRDFQNANINQLPEILSNHPTNQSRIRTLERHFRDNPSVFSRFNPDASTATPLVVANDAPVQFLRPDASD